jgi:ribonuclease VapC
MVIDTSAVVAILLDEPERRRFGKAIERDPVRLMSAGTLVESSLVMEVRRHDEGTLGLDRLIRSAAVTIVPVDLEQAQVARTAFHRFGRGRHRAGLNLGDCFAYALAVTSGEPLLFKGDDFGHTDLTPVES